MIAGPDGWQLAPEGAAVHPVERVARDLSTYLRQPFPDGALEDAAAFVAAEDAPPWSVLEAFPW